jgi:hypothetical protein
MTVLQKIAIHLLTAGVSVAIGLSLPVSVKADPPPWAPAHGYRHKHKKVAYKYMYYPSSQVYYSPVRRGYYYPYNGGWQYNTVLPPTISLGKAVNITLGGATPYVYHPTVIQQYPVVVVP